MPLGFIWNALTSPLRRTCKREGCFNKVGVASLSSTHGMTYWLMARPPGEREGYCTPCTIQCLTPDCKNTKMNLLGKLMSTCEHHMKRAKGVKVPDDCSCDGCVEKRKRK